MIGSATSAVRVSFTQQDITAHNVANVNTPGYQAMRTDQVEIQSGGVAIGGLARVPNADPTSSGTDLAISAGEQIKNEYTSSANLRAIQVQQRMIGEVLDLFA